MQEKNPIHCTMAQVSPDSNKRCRIQTVSQVINESGVYFRATPLKFNKL